MYMIVTYIMMCVSIICINALLYYITSGINDPLSVIFCFLIPYVTYRMLKSDRFDDEYYDSQGYPPDNDRNMSMDKYYDPNDDTWKPRDEDIKH